MHKRSEFDGRSALYALLGAGLGGAGGYGLYKLLTPKARQSADIGLGSTALGALAGGALTHLGLNKYQQIQSDMLAEGLKKQEEIAKKVQDQIDSLSSNP